MTNEHIWELMQRDLDGDLSPDEQLLLHSSIKTDPDLQLMYGRLKKVSDQLEQLPPVTPAFSIVDSILPQLDAISREPVATAEAVELPRLEVKKEAPVPGNRKWKKLPVWMARAGSGVAAACLLLGLFFMVNGPARNESDTMTQGAEATPAVKEQPDVATPPVPKTDNGNHITPPSEKPDKPATPQGSGDNGSTKPEKPNQQVAPKPSTAIQKPAVAFPQANEKPAADTATKNPKAKFPATLGTQRTDKDDHKQDVSRQAAGKDHRVERKNDKEDKDDKEKDRDGDDEDRDDERRRGEDKNDDSRNKKAINTKNGSYSPLLPIWKRGFIDLKWTGTNE
jgi:negative regulator of sigma E activity